MKKMLDIAGNKESIVLLKEQIVSYLCNVTKSEGCSFAINREEVDQKEYSFPPVIEIMNSDLLIPELSELFNKVIGSGKNVIDNNCNIVKDENLNIRSVCCVPINMQSENVGVIYTYNKKNKKNFTRTDAMYLRFCSDILTSVLTNKSLIDLSFRQNDLDVVNKIVSILGSRTDPKELYVEVVRQIGITLNCSHCTLFLKKKVDKKPALVPVSSWAWNDDVSICRNFDANEGLIGKVNGQGFSEIFNDAANHEAFAVGVRKTTYHHRSMLISPILTGTETVGMICADQTELDWFSENDRKLVDSLAIHIGIAIERALLLEATRDISKKLIKGLNPIHFKEILEIVLKNSAELAKATSGVVYLLSGDNKTIIDRCIYPEGFPHPYPRRDANGDFIGLTKRAITEKKGFIISKEECADIINPGLKDKVMTMAVYPLLSQDSVVGILFLNDEECHFYTQVEKTMLEIISNQAGIALMSLNMITELKESKQEIAALFEDSMKDKARVSIKMFYGEISHDVKNVLAQVKLNMINIQESSGINKIAKPIRSRVETLISRTNDSINNIQMFLKMVSEEQVDMIPYSVEVMLDRAIELLKSRIEDNEVFVSRIYTSQAIRVYAHPTEIIMAFFNLIDNAIDALKMIRRKRCLDISCQVDEDGKMVVVAIHDNGCGISKENIKNIYHPFFSTKRKTGRGMGLCGAKRIIEEHFGRVPKPISELGKGTVFTVYLPITYW